MTGDRIGNISAHLSYPFEYPTILTNVEHLKKYKVDLRVEHIIQ